jgi:drug/metabolite transporter (DMT)-like permease
MIQQKKDSVRADFLGFGSAAFLGFGSAVTDFAIRSAPTEVYGISLYSFYIFVLELSLHAKIEGDPLNMAEEVVRV